MMVASCSIVHPSILACQGMIPVNVTAEGYPGKRYHAGCREIDKIEQMAIDRAKNVFHAKYANVQPHSATTANEIVLYSLLNAGDTILGMDLASGGHLSHGAKVSFSGTYFNAVKYGLDKNSLIDYDQVEDLALKYKPKLIICGTSAYPRKIDFKRFREIADKVDAYLLADISHISGLVITGHHPSPIDYAHITTTCTHKQLFGTRGGLILSGKDYNMPLPNKKLTLSEQIQKAVFPFFQGAPMINLIAAKALTLKYAQESQYKQTINRIIELAKSLSDHLIHYGFNIITQGTDTHIVLVDLSNKNLTGDVVEKALEECGIIVNKNSVPNRKNPSLTPAGIRLGTNSLAQRKLTVKEMKVCAELINIVVENIKDNRLNKKVKEKVRAKVKYLCNKFPIKEYLNFEHQLKGA